MAEKRFRGVFNRYQKSKSLPKYLIEDLRCCVTIPWLYLRNGFEHKVMVVYPHYPSKRSSVYRIAKQLGYHLTNKLDPRASVVVYWEYQTFRKEFEPIARFAEKIGARVINFHNRDISKKFVDAEFEKAFGYSITIDPRRHQGKAVEKSDINATHDGRVIDCPFAEPDPGKVYQRLVDNTAGEGFVKDLRVPIFAGEIPFVYIKFRPVGERFKNSTTRTELVEPSAAFSADELAKIKTFCANIALDHGELDVLRDNQSGLIYIVDVNNTPQSPPANSERSLHDKAVALMAQTFSRAFLN